MKKFSWIEIVVGIVSIPLLPLMFIGGSIYKGWAFANAMPVEISEAAVFVVEVINIYIPGVLMLAGLLFGIAFITRWILNSDERVENKKKTIKKPRQTGKDRLPKKRAPDKPHPQAGHGISDS